MQVRDLSIGLEKQKFVNTMSALQNNWFMLAWVRRALDAIADWDVAKHSRS